MIAIDKKGISEIVNNADGTSSLKCGLLADTSAEVIAIGNDASTIDGCGIGDKLLPFCTCFTADQELGVLGSDGAWKF